MTAHGQIQGGFGLDRISLQMIRPGDVRFHPRVWKKSLHPRQSLQGKAATALGEDERRRSALLEKFSEEIRAVPEVRYIYYHQIGQEARR